MSVVEWACAARTLGGQTHSGDRGLVLPSEHGALAAVIDGLGHGPEAAVAAERAEATLRRMLGHPLVDIVRACHEECRSTRGVVLSVAQFEDAGTMSWLGVGNVEALLIRSETSDHEAVAARGGTVGYRLPPLHPRSLAVRPGDTLVLASDGIEHGFKQEILPLRSPQQIADQVLARWAKVTDDACTVVVRYLGAARESGTVRGRSWA